MPNLVSQLEAHGEYPKRFEGAFPGEGISEQTISKAISQFLRTLVSFNSRADVIDSGQITLSDQERRGMELMTGGLPLGAKDAIPDLCDACHQHAAGMVDSFPGMALFTSSEAKANGLALAIDDQGVGARTKAPEDTGRFIVPTIRNVSVTAPYMHDGRFDTLDEVVLHYDQQMMASPALERPLAKDGEPIRLNMSADDRAAVAAVLAIFTDPHFLENPAFADPTKASD